MKRDFSTVELIKASVQAEMLDWVERERLRPAREEAKRRQELAKQRVLSIRARRLMGLDQ